jgi:hypothetical protein
LSRISEALGIFKWIQPVKYFRDRGFLKRVSAWTAIASALPAACCGVSERIRKLIEFLSVKEPCSLLQGTLQSSAPPVAGFKLMHIVSGHL